MFSSGASSTKAQSRVTKLPSSFFFALAQQKNLSFFHSILSLHKPNQGTIPHSTMNNYEVATSNTPPSSFRDDILQQLFDQAMSVRRTFEEPPYYSSSKRKNTVSSSTAAAARHMASVNRKRKFEHQLWTASGGSAAPSLAFAPAFDEEIAMPSQGRFKQARHTFFSPISSSMYTLSGEGRQPKVPLPRAPTTVVIKEPRMATDIVLKAHPTDLTLTYNDVVCGSGATTSSLVGNQRFKVWINTHKSSFMQSSSLCQDDQIARSVVNTVMSSVPQGRFISMDMRTGLWYVVGYERSVEIVLEALVAETTEGGMLTNMLMNKLNGGGGGIIKERGHVPRVLVSKAA